MSIITTVENVAEDVIDTIVTEAKQIATAAVAYIKVVGTEALDLLVERIKETTLGTAIANLISAASSSTGTGYEKFAAVLLAAQNAWDAFTANGGLSGLWDSAKSAFVYVVQKIYEQIFGSVTGETA